MDRGGRLFLLLSPPAPSLSSLSLLTHRGHPRADDRVPVRDPQVVGPGVSWKRERERERERGRTSPGPAPRLPRFFPSRLLTSLSGPPPPHPIKNRSGPRVVKGERFHLARADGSLTGGVASPTSAAAAASGFLRAMSDAGLKPTVVYHNLTPAELYEQALKYEPGTHIMASGALAALSGAKTGRSPRDKRIVREPSSEADIWWNAPGNGSPNYEMDAHTFLLNRERAIDYLNMLDRIYVFDGFAGWEPASRIKVRVVCGRAYHALFMHNMLIRPTDAELASFGNPDFTILNAGAFPVNRYTSYMSSSTSVDVNLASREMVILGTQYAGEMKKGIFSVMHYLMPKRGILSLHSGCNVGAADDVTLFFGLSGTGKTTLSTDHARPLIGDDEHCWSDDGVFNIEGGCYAKCIGLKASAEPEIWKAIRFGAVLENVVFDAHSRAVDFGSNAVTENTRASYPIEHIDNARLPCVGPHPRNLVLLCCDAFGVLPPVARLDSAQAMYHFISGYTAKVAGTEVGVTEPEATFSACFGGVFLMWHPMKVREGEERARGGRRGGVGWSARARMRARERHQQTRPRSPPHSLTHPALALSLSPPSVRRHAGRQDGPPRHARLAGQHGLDGRRVRGGEPHQAAPHARDPGCHPRRGAAGRAHGPHARVWAGGADGRAGRAGGDPGPGVPVGGQGRLCGHADPPGRDFRGEFRQVCRRRRLCAARTGGQDPGGGAGLGGGGGDGGWGGGREWQGRHRRREMKGVGV